MGSPRRSATPPRPRRARCTSVRRRSPRPTRKANRSARKASGLTLRNTGGGKGICPCRLSIVSSTKHERVAESIFVRGVPQMNRKGFTLIELLIVVVIIGILAAIAIPKFANTKEKAYLASMKSDLRNLVTAEEAYFADSVKYTSNLS